MSLQTDSATRASDLPPANQSSTASTEDASALPPTSTSTPPTANSETPRKPASDPITPLTPEQVLQELKKSGYVDQLRRQMFDAFTSAAKPPPAPAAVDPTNQPTTGTSSTADSPQTPTAIHAPAASTATNNASAGETRSAPPQPAAASGSTVSGTSAMSMDVSSKAAFLTSLSPALRQQVEKEHAQLRFLDARGQQDKLLKLLESEPIADAHTDDTLGDGATLYDLVIRHIVTPDGTDATAGMLHKQGSIGKEANARIAEVINDLLNPGRKEVDQDESADEDDDDDDDEPDAPTHPTTSASTAMEQE